MAFYASEAATPLLDAAVNGFVDYKHRPVTRSNSGGWRSAVFIVGVEVAERSACYGISSNLISYLTGPLGQSTATAAEDINLGLPVWHMLWYLHNPLLFFTKQGVTMDRSLGPGFSIYIPPASLQTLRSLSIVIFLPIYDRIFVPIARAVTGKPSGITKLQRIGFGIFLSVISMVIAALVERKRFETALEYGLIDNPKATVPMIFWWLAPQYMLFGIADAFTMVGLQEFFLMIRCRVN